MSSYSWGRDRADREKIAFNDGGPPSTIYDVLRKLVRDAPWNELDRNRSEELIAELQSFNIFGTVAEQLTTKGKP